MRQAKVRQTLMSLVLIIALAGMIAVSCAPPSDGDGNGNGAPPVVEPRYGGILRIATTTTVVGFDDAIVEHRAATTKLTHEEVWEGDWAKGYADGYGTKESPWTSGGGLNRLEHKTGALAERVEWTTDLTKITLYIRQGVKWHDKPPTNGREVTAEDVAFSIRRQYTLPSAYMYKSYPDACAATTISVVDNTVILELDDPQYFVEVITMLDYMNIYPKDAVEFYGDMNDWENSIGTGPFILTDYVLGDSLTYVRNDNYWRTNPVGPGEGDQLPYLDGLEMYIVPDVATEDALLMAGEIDILTITDPERAQYFIDNYPQLEYNKFLEEFASPIISMRTDREPYSDVRVRQALMLAIDNQRILDELYAGEGLLLKWPVMYYEAYKGAYVPLEDFEDDMIEVLPGRNISVADLYGYNPELAKELLKAAGYEGGFSAEILVFNHPHFLDPITMVVAMWKEVGVDVEIVPLDYTTWTARLYTRNYDHMLAGIYSGVGSYMKGINWSGPSMFNSSYVDDPVLNEARDDMMAAFPNEAAVDALHRDMLPHLLEQVYVLGLPAGYYYTFWWPWVRNFNGEWSVGYYNLGNGAKYNWIDQEMKENMGY